MLQWTTRFTPARDAASMTVATARRSRRGIRRPAVLPDDVVDDLGMRGALDCRGVANVARRQGDTVGPQRTGPRLVTHERDHIATSRLQSPSEMSAGEAGGARHQNAHRRIKSDSAPATLSATRVTGEPNIPRSPALASRSSIRPVAFADPSCL